MGKVAKVKLSEFAKVKKKLNCYGVVETQGGRGHWTVYYTSPQSFMIMFSYSLTLQLWELSILIVRFIKLSVQTFQPLMERVGRMPLPINRHAQVGLPDKGLANKGLVVCWMTQYTVPGYKSVI